MIEDNPSETARHALKLLASRKLAPTPDNFTSIFYGIAGDKPDADPQDAGRVALMHELHEQLARTVECCLPVLGEDDANIDPATWAPIRACQSEFEGLGSLNSEFSTFNHRLSLATED